MQENQKIVNPPAAQGKRLDKKVTDLFDLFRFLLARWMKIALVGLICVVLMLGWIFLLAPDTYQATEKLYMSSSSSLVDLSDLQLGSSLSNDYAQVFHNAQVHEEVRQALRHEYTDKELDRMINVSTPGNTHILIVTVTADNGYLAQRMVEKYCEVAQQFINNITGRFPPVFEEAQLVEPQRHLARNSVIAFVVGALLACLAYAAMFFFDDRILDRESIESKVGVAVLGTLPPVSRS